MKKDIVDEINILVHNVKEAQKLPDARRKKAFIVRSIMEVERKLIELGRLIDPRLRAKNKAFDLGMTYYEEVKGE